MSEEMKMNENADGQLEIAGIDTPLGEAANDFLKLVDALNKMDEEVSEAKEKILVLMEEQGMKTFGFEGKTFTKTEEATLKSNLRVTNKVKKRKNETE